MNFKKFKLESKSVINCFMYIGVNSAATFHYGSFNQSIKLNI